jgi:hypothetical protein
MRKQLLPPVLKTFRDFHRFAKRATAAPGGNNYTVSSEILARVITNQSASLTITGNSLFEGRSIILPNGSLSISASNTISLRDILNSSIQLGITGNSIFLGRNIVNSSGVLTVRPTQVFTGELDTVLAINLQFSPSSTIYGENVVFAREGGGEKILECIVLGRCILNSAGQLTITPTSIIDGEVKLVSSPTLSMVGQAQANANAHIFSLLSLTVRPITVIDGRLILEVATGGNTHLISATILGKSELIPTGVLSIEGFSTLQGSNILLPTGSFGLSGSSSLGGNLQLNSSITLNITASSLVELQAKLFADLTELGVEVNSIREFILYITRSIEKDLYITRNLNSDLII